MEFSDLPRPTDLRLKFTAPLASAATVDGRTPRAHVDVRSITAGAAAAPCDERRSAERGERPTQLPVCRPAPPTVPRRTTAPAGRPTVLRPPDEAAAFAP